MIVHASTCSPNYPEKPPHEKPQHIVIIKGEEPGIEIHQCADCGAFEEVKESTSNETA